VDRKLGRIMTNDESNSDGLAKYFSKFLRLIDAEISENWKYLMKKFPLDYEEISFEEPEYR